jgi:hypothetical protein
MFDLELRDWLAGQAMTGLLTGPNAPKKSKTESSEQYAVRVAEEAYLLADAMVKTRSEQELGAESGER